MKRLYLLILFALCVHVSFGRIFTGQCGEDLIYIFNSETGALKIEGSGPMYDFQDPYINSGWGKDVYRSDFRTVELPEGLTSIGNYAFWHAANIETIHIPSSVTKIGEYAFAQCSKLTSIDIPNSVTTIGQRAFEESGLINVKIPGSIRTVYYAAFYKCNDLTDVTLSEGVTIIDFSVFASCRNLTSVTFPNSLTTIKDGAFYCCSNLTSLTLPNSLTEIGWGAFQGCSSLTSITIPNSVKEISNTAFADCWNLSSITLPQGIEAIAQSVFYGCRNLTSIDIPDGVKTIGSSSFYKCTSLTSVRLPETLTSIGDNAFNGCSVLSSISIPKSVGYVGVDVFGNCPAITNPLYSETLFILMPKSAKGHFTVPEGIKTIMRYAFYGCSKLTSINLPATVDSIGYGAFRRCTSLTSCNIPDGVKLLNGDTFAMTGLTSVSIPRSVKRICYEAFSGCKNLESIVLPYGVEFIEDCAFFGCSSLKFVSVPASIKISDKGQPFLKCEAIETVLWDAETKYPFLNLFEPIVKELYIGDSISVLYPIGSSYLLEKVVLGKNVVRLCDDSFYSSMRLKDLYITGNELPTCESRTFNVNKLSSATLYVSKDLIPECQSQEPWKFFGNILPIEDHEPGYPGAIPAIYADGAAADEAYIKVSSEAGSIAINGLKDGEVVEMYALNGSKLSSTISSHSTATLTAQIGQVVVIAAGGKRVKLLVK